MKLETLEKISIVLPVAAYVVFLFLLKHSGISVGYIVNLQNSLLKSMIVGSSDLGTASSLLHVLAPFSTIFLAVIVLVLSFSFVSSYGYFSADKRIGAVIGAICVVLTVILFPTVMGLFIAASAFVSFVFLIPLSNTYGKELKKWVLFRVGSNSVSKALLVTNILMALGILFAVLLGMQYYQASFRQDLTETMTTIALESLPPEAQLLGKDLVENQISSSIEDSKIFNAYFRWLPLISGFSFWVIMEFFRNLVFSNIGGLFTHFAIKLFSRFEE